MTTAPVDLTDAVEVAATFADDVDAAARFPVEAVDALKQQRLLGALIPVAAGGLGLRLTDVAHLTRRLGQVCSSTGMVFAMHQIQVACLVRHGRSSAATAYATRVAAEQLLLASATTEINIGGNIRTSGCAVERAGDIARLVKVAPVISYGARADAILATARRDPESPPSDQVLLVCPREDLELEQISGWDTLGFRGTESNGFRLTAETSADLVLDDPFAEISSHSMLPVAHLLWSSLWLGMAEAAERKARRFVQAQARRTLGSVPPGALRLAELHTVLLGLRASVDGMLSRFEAAEHDPAATAETAFVIDLNTVKISASTLVVDIVMRAVAVCGIEAYRNDSDFTLGRLLRDAHGAALMVGNDRIAANNAQLLLVHRAGPT